VANEDRIVGARRAMPRARHARRGWIARASHAILLANGVARELLAVMIRDGYAVAVTTVIRASRKPIPVSYVKITEAGRQALLLGSGTRTRSIARRGLRGPRSLT
jgi:hypothetical protein